MTHKRLAMAVVASVGAVLLVGASAITRVTAQTRQAPTFQVDSTWPALPNSWVLGTVTSVTVVSVYASRPALVAETWNPRQVPT